MKSIKKFLTLTLASGILFAQGLFLANAQENTRFIDQNSFIYLDVNLNQSSFLQDLLKQINTPDLDNDLHFFLLESLAKNQISFGISQHQKTNEDIFKLVIPTTESRFKSLIENLKSDENLEELNFNQHNFYLTNDDFYFTYHQGALIASNLEGVLSDTVLNNYPSLNQNKAYQNIKNNQKKDGFLNIFFNFEKLADLELTELDQFYAMVKTYGLNFQQNSNGFNLNMLMEVEPSYNLFNSSFTPTLHQKVNAENIIFYQEDFKLIDNLESSLKLLSDYELGYLDPNENILTSLKNALKEELNLNWDLEIKKLFNQKLAFAIHSTKEVPLGITLIAEINSIDSNLAQEFNQKLASQIIDSLNQNLIEYSEYYQTELANIPKDFKDTFYKYNEVKLSNGQFILIDLTNQNDFEDFTLFSELYLGVNNGNLIISTISPELALNNSGLSQNSEFKKSFSNLNQNYLEIGFIDFNNLQKVLNNLFANDFNSQKEINELLAPLQSLSYQSKKLDNNLIQADVNLNFNFNQAVVYQSYLGNFTEIFNNLLNFSNNYDEDFNLDSKCYNFQDVNEEDWFHYYISDACEFGLMKGYQINSESNDDLASEFKPNQTITRAEFIKTIMNSQRELDFFYAQPAKESENKFSDLDQTAWYYEDIIIAADNGYIQGYTDGTFRPNQTISRAEALQIIKNIENSHFDETSSSNAESSSNENQPSLTFEDVSTDDWFYQAVYNAFSKGYVEGKESNLFAPHDNLSRAETAKIVLNYYFEHLYDL